MAKSNNNKKCVIEVSDFLFANPLAKRREVMAKFGKAWQISPRTIDRLIKEATQYNHVRLKEQEKARREESISAARGAAKRDIASREEILAELTKILRGKAVKVPSRMDKEGNILMYDISYPSHRDIIAAGGSIAQLEGYFAPTKQEITGKGGAAIIPEPTLTKEQIEKLIDKL